MNTPCVTRAHNVAPAVLLFLTIFCMNTSATPPNQIGTVVNLLEKNKNQAITFKKVGNHIIAEFTECTNLNDIVTLKKVLRCAAEAALATVLSVTTHQFEPQGMTGVAVLQESHISVHTWPEYGYASIDIYTCGDHILIEKALEVLQEFFRPQRVRVVTITRGFEDEAL